MFAAEGYGGEDVFFIAREDDADWDLAVVGTVGGVEGTAAGVEADVSAKVAAERGFEGRGITGRGGSIVGPRMVRRSSGRFGRYWHRTYSRKTGAGRKGRRARISCQLSVLSSGSFGWCLTVVSVAALSGAKPCCHTV
jgi:hypothetical protein